MSNQHVPETPEDSGGIRSASGSSLESGSPTLRRGRSFRLKEKLRAVPWWVVSIALHLVAILVFGQVVLSKARHEELVDPLQVTIQPPAPKPLTDEDLKKIRDYFAQTPNVPRDDPKPSPFVVESKLPDSDRNENPQIVPEEGFQSQSGPVADSEAAFIEVPFAIDPGMISEPTPVFPSFRKSVGAVISFEWADLRIFPRPLFPIV